MFKQFPLGECVILNIAAVVGLLWLMHSECIKPTNSLSLCSNPLTVSEYWIQWFCWMKPSGTIMKHVFFPLKPIHSMFYCMLNKTWNFAVCHTSKSLNASPHALDSAKQTEGGSIAGPGGQINGIYYTVIVLYLLDKTSLYPQRWLLGKLLWKAISPFIPK